MGTLSKGQDTISQDLDAVNAIFEQMAVERAKSYEEFVQEAQENHLNRYVSQASQVTLV